jgi:hypothetical protein
MDTEALPGSKSTFQGFLAARRKTPIPAEPRPQTRRTQTTGEKLQRFQNA